MVNKEDAYNIINDIMKTAQIDIINEALCTLHDTCEWCKDCAVCPLETECNNFFNVMPRLWNVTRPTLKREEEE